MSNSIHGFQIDDIDGCEFVKSSNIGSLMISLHQDDESFYTGEIHVVYPDASHTTITKEEAQMLIDSGEWMVLLQEEPMKKIYRTYADTEVTMLSTEVKCPYCGNEWFEEDKNDCGNTYTLRCDDEFDNGCGKEFEMHFDAS
ncbi:hypothetical protein [Paenibacillus macquariensis]|uniref:Uncharacterized protein n=1 Tax=Paenibacillus macquariensis TaxID=948756 RepID=A0ABY1JX76_9BACL|nr:hypothetical protein [Paenibacillus macquariensis]MEC0089360.1 hypothetical protein [Paenibacillus macquariensis]OAB33244.1 hypothetical protein PMSM_14615 [Paenibacillus macquariensis subsp. macquariensis]SIQ93052.1 hypothetical protein SAMN05421578_10599 [Paenibacillus macquariensis]